MAESSAQASETAGTTVTPSDRPERSGSPGPSDDLAPSATLSSGTAIQYTGTVRIAGVGPDLDVAPPKLDQDAPDIELDFIDPPRIGTDFSGLALWSGPAMPARQQCSDLIATQGVRRVEVKKGTVVCLQTDAGRIAVLTVTSTSNTFGTGVLAQVSVWPETSA
ncbi:hypothetical protein [Streptomyces youssoufiensis]